jgi:hypothetical protein
LKYSDPSGENPLGLLLLLTDPAVATIVTVSTVVASPVLPIIAVAVVVTLYVADVANSISAANTANNLAVQNVSIPAQGSSSFVTQVDYAPQNQKYGNDPRCPNCTGMMGPEFTVTAGRLPMSPKVSSWAQMPIAMMQPGATTSTPMQTDNQPLGIVEQSTNDVLNAVAPLRPSFMSLNLASFNWFGGKTSIDANWQLRGRGTSVFLPAFTFTQGVQVSNNVSVGILSSTSWTYNASPLETDRSMLTTNGFEKIDGQRQWVNQTPYIDFSGGEFFQGGFGFALTPVLSNTDKGFVGSLVTASVSLKTGINVGPAVGGAGGVSNTWVIWDAANLFKSK